MKNNLLEQKVLGLSEKERINLILKLLESLENGSGAVSTTDSWVGEAENRYQAWKRGEVKTVSEEEATKRLQQALKE